MEHKLEAAWGLEAGDRPILDGDATTEECRENFLNQAEGDDVLPIPRYTKPQRSGHSRRR